MCSRVDQVVFLAASLRPVKMWAAVGDAGNCVGDLTTELI